MTKVIGITGGIASGKSTVSNYLISLGYPLVDCDLLTRNAYNDCFSELQAAFPDCIDGQQIDRQKLAACIFQNSKAKIKLESIIHPYCLKKMQEAIQRQKEGLIFLDIPLLFEAKMEDLCDEIWVIYVSFETQLQRLMARNNFSKEEATKRIEAQMSIETKKALADYIIYNENTIEKTIAQVKKRLGELDE